MIKRGKDKYLCDFCEKEVPNGDFSTIELHADPHTGYLTRFTNAVTALHNRFMRGRAPNPTMLNLRLELCQGCYLKLIKKLGACLGDLI